MRAGRSVGHDFPSFDVLPLEHGHLAPLGNEHLVVRAPIERISPVGRRDDQAALALGFLAEADRAGDFRENGWLFRFASFK